MWRGGQGVAFDEFNESDLLPYLLPHSLTHSLTLWSRVLSEKLAGSKLVREFPTFYGAQRFVTALTRASHLSLS